MILPQPAYLYDFFSLSTSRVLMFLGDTVLCHETLTCNESSYVANHGLPHLSHQVGRKLVKRGCSERQLKMQSGYFGYCQTLKKHYFANIFLQKWSVNTIVVLSSHLC